MNPDTGKLYPNIEEALRQGEKFEQLVTVAGSKEQVEKLSDDIKKVRQAEVLFASSVKTRNAA